MQLSKHFNFYNRSPQPELLVRDSEQSTPSMLNQEDERIANRSSQEQSQNSWNSINEIRFFQEYKKIYNVAYHLTLQKNRQSIEFNKLLKRLELLEQKIQKQQDQEIKKMDNSESQNREKRIRRTAQMIQKKFKCNADLCDRQYGYQGSLQQHIKLKHPEIYKIKIDENIDQNINEKNLI